MSEPLHKFWKKNFKKLDLYLLEKSTTIELTCFQSYDIFRNLSQQKAKVLNSFSLKGEHVIQRRKETF